MRTFTFFVGLFLLLMSGALAVFGTVLADGERDMRQGALLIAAMPASLGVAMIVLSVARERRDAAMRRVLKDDR
jgi:Na+-translocating ferredoxin:NAD+ oxidoreductase RnfA subunit